MQPIIPANKAPVAAPTRNSQFRYPWEKLAPGDCFEFSPHVKISSARVMCANNGVDTNRRFRCFRGADGKVYAQRMDGMLTDLQAVQTVEAPIKRAGETPEIHEDFGVFGAGMTAANVSTIENKPPLGPPMPKPGPSASDLAAARINAERDANVARMEAEERAREDDVI